MVELRKRKEAPPAPLPAAKKEKKAKASKATNGEAAASEAPAAPKEDDPKASTKSGPPKVGETVSLDGFGGEVETHEGKAVTLKSLVDASKAGVVLFTYPKASTPGCRLHHLPSWFAYDTVLIART